MKCQKCGKTLDECNSWFKRINKGELPPIWECAKPCETPKIDQDTAVIAAIEGE